MISMALLARVGQADTSDAKANATFEPLQVRTTQSYDRRTQAYVVQATLTNVSADEAPGPWGLLLTGCDEDNMAVFGAAVYVTADGLLAVVGETDSTLSPGETTSSVWIHVYGPAGEARRRANALRVEPVDPSWYGLDEGYPASSAGGAPGPTTPFSGRDPCPVGITDGGFVDPGLSDWVIFGPVINAGGFAHAVENPDSFLTSLEQCFNIPESSLQLVFEFDLLSVEGGPSGFPIPDSLSVSLLDAGTLAPLISREPGATDFFNISRAGDAYYNPATVDYEGSCVVLDISSLPAGIDALIVFDLMGGNDGYRTSVDVDNVATYECDPAGNDCQPNGMGDSCDILDGTSVDCDFSGVPDECELRDGILHDDNENGTPDECELDCNSNTTYDFLDITQCGGNDCNASGVPDDCEVPPIGVGPDCNSNGIPDECDISGGASQDCQPNDIPDECEFDDCNRNCVPDDQDILFGTSEDCNENGQPDECEIDRNSTAPGGPFFCITDCDPDCNDSGIPDACDISAGTSQDCQPNGIPDECDIASGTSQDINGDGIPDECGLYFITVDSPPYAGAAIEVDPVDESGRGDGVTPFQRNYAEDLTVTLTAEPTHLDAPFVRWVLDGVDQTAGETVLIIPSVFDHYLASAMYDYDCDVCPDGSCTYQTIQAAIDAVPNGTEVVVCPGTYYENINFNGKAITVRSAEPADPGVVRTTIIDGGFNDVVVTFENGEGLDSVLEGFTIRRGNGGVACMNCSPTVRHNYIVGNIGYYWGGAGVFCSNSSAEITRNRIESNEDQTGWGGGGIYAEFSSSYAPTIRSNEIVCNTSPWAYGGGMYLYGSSTPATVRNNTVVGNSANYGGGGVYCTGPGLVISNSIIWGNGDDLLLENGATIEYSVVEDTEDLGIGVIHVDPLFMEPDGPDFSPATCDDNDYRLAACSPCFEAGNPSLSPDPGETDVDGEDRLMGVRIDMGSDEFTVASGCFILRVASTPAHGVPIDVSIADVNGCGTDDTSFALTYCSTEDVTLTAPAEVGGRAFVRWTLDGADQPDGVQTLVMSMDDHHDAVAVYEDVWFVCWDGTGDFTGIQEALDSPDILDGVEIEVCPGTYTLVDESLNFNGKAITVRSTNPCDPDVVAATIIDGSELSNKSVVRFDSEEDEQSVLAGFTITGANHSGDGGGIYCYQNTSPTIRNNVITGNQSGYGAGIYCRYDSAPRIERNVILDNLSTTYGGGIYANDTTAIIINNIIARNQSRTRGGGLYTTGTDTPEIRNNTIVANVSPWGGGIYQSGGALSVRNCIVWDNADDLYNVSSVAYSCVQDIDDSGTGVIHSDPLFVDAVAGAYHIWPNSPCRNAGHTAWVEPEETDIDCESRVAQGNVDIGADEIDSTACDSILWVTSTTAPGVSIAVSPADVHGQDDGLTHFSRCYDSATPVELTAPYTDGRNPFVRWVLNGEEQQDGDRTLDITMTGHHTARAVYLTSWSVCATGSPDFTGIQEAIDDSGVQDGDEIVVCPGTYVEHIDFHGKAVTLRSSDPQDPSVVAATIIQGDGTNHVVTFDENEGPDTVLAGFTITEGGGTGYGGGVYCYYASPTIRDSIIEYNVATSQGGGIYCTNSVARIDRNVIRDNWADNDGGGIYLTNSPSPILDNMLIKNHAGSMGGGIYSYGTPIPTIRNNTIVYNKATTTSDNKGGGIYRSSGSIAISNCIVWGNTDDLYNVAPLYSDIEDADGCGSSGNLCQDPYFVDPLAGEYHLLPDSPCVNVGDPNTSPESGETDIDGEDRELDGRIDMGADEVDATACDAVLWVTSVPPDIDVTVSPQDVNGESDGAAHFSRCYTLGTQVSLQVPASVGAYTFVRWVLDDVDQPDGETNLLVDMNLAYRRARAVYDGLWTVCATGGDFTSIQDAIDYRYVRDGDVVEVCPGTYVENITFRGKAITLRSEDPTDPATVQQTIIDGSGDWDLVVIFEQGEGPDSILDGFTITGGEGGIACLNASPSIRHNFIVDNTGYYYGGGGIYCSASSAVVTNNRIENNEDQTGYGGGGIYAEFSDLFAPTICNNEIFWNRSPYGSGGGMYLWGSSPPAPVRNNTVIHNSAQYEGHGIYCSGEGMVISNSILWDNGDDLYLQSGATVEYSNIENIDDTGTGVIHEDPLFADPVAGEYHLLATSPCRNAGDPATTPDPDEADIDGEPRVAEGVIDMGADEVDSTACGVVLWVTSTVEPGVFIEVSVTDANGESDGITHFSRCYDSGMPFPVELTAPADDGRNPFIRWVLDEGDQPDGVQTLNVNMSDPHTARAVYLTTWSVCSTGSPDFTGIQEALDDVNVQDGDEIVVCPGTYAEDIEFHGKAVTLRSSDPQDPSIVATTVIQGSGSTRVVTFDEDEGPKAVLAGFTITQGDSYNGGGIYCYYASPTIRNNVIEGNQASYGGGVYCSSGSPRIYLNTIQTNNASSYGAGIYLSYSAAEIRDNVIVENQADSRGGGIYSYGSTVPQIRNNTIADNEAYTSSDYKGGGIYRSSGSITILNCIVWGNTDDLYNVTPVYSNIEDADGCGSDGNICQDPLFVDSAADDYHILASSPCKDTGDPDTLVDPGEVDIDGEDRVMDDRIDMGADEYMADCNGNGIPDDEDIANGTSFDCDGNGIPDECEALPIGPVVYVDADATSGANDGSSWADAFIELQDALCAASRSGGAVTEIWVAEGTYEPAGPGGDRTATLRLLNGTGVYGGFEGWETAREQRDPDPQTNGTALSGDLNHDDLPDFENNDENSYHVVTADGTDATAIMDGFTITAGNADYDDYGPSIHRNGAGIYNDGGSPTVSNCFLYRNATICEWNNMGLGGGMYNTGSTALPTLTACTFMENVASRGAGMYNGDAAGPILMYCTFNANSMSTPRAYSGGAIHNHTGTSPLLTNCTFTNNLADVGGAMANIGGSPVLIDCVFENNVGNSAGGAINGVQSSSATVQGCSFTGNMGGVCGGAVNSESSIDLTFTDCTFTNNSGCSGGAVCTNDSTGLPAVNFMNCTFIGNTGVDMGGAVYYDSSGSFVNCVFSGNSLDGRGGGLYNVYGSPTLTNCTFSNNTAGDIGGGLYNQVAGYPVLTNCIVWGCSPDAIGVHPYSGGVIATYSDIAGGWPGEGNIATDPYFTDAPAHDVHLLPNSPCINGGDDGAPLLPDEDFEGEPRIQQGRVDMGADESPYIRDCNDNGVPDEDDIALGTSKDCNVNAVPDECEADHDCNGNKVPDECEGSGDVNFDCMVNIDDYGVFFDCMGGPGDPYPQGLGCIYFDVDGDLDIDMADFAGFQTLMGSEPPYCSEPAGSCDDSGMAGLKLKSNRSNVSVTAIPNPLFENGLILSPQWLELSYEQGSEVTLTYVGTPPQYVVFSGWRVDGNLVAETSVTVTAGEDSEVTAVFTWFASHKKILVDQMYPWP